MGRVETLFSWCEYRWQLRFGDSLQLETLIEISVIYEEIPVAEPVGGLGWKEMVR